MSNIPNEGVEVQCSGQTVDRERYVTQLEKRCAEQEDLIALLKDKVRSLELGAGSGAATYSNVAANAPSSADGGDLHAHSRAKPPLSFIGSRKSGVSLISTVPHVRYAQFFVTRIDPAISSRQMAEYLLGNLPELSFVRCSKIKTRHSSYASFHVVVPELQTSLVSCGDAWPEGTLVKLFVGKLLNSYILESFNSESPDVPAKPKGPSSSTADSKNSSTPSARAQSSPAPVVNGKAGNPTAVKSKPGDKPKKPAPLTRAQTNDSVSPKFTRNRAQQKFT